MKIFCRIILGLLFFPLPLFLGTWIWLFTIGKESWSENVGKLVWQFISGQWDNFLDDDDY